MTRQITFNREIFSEENENSHIIKNYVVYFFLSLGFHTEIIPNLKFSVQADTDILIDLNFFKVQNTCY